MFVRRNRIRCICLAIPALLGVPFTLRAQAVPAGVQHSEARPGFFLPNIGGTLSYSVTASENFLFGYNNGYNNESDAYTNLSGDVAYLSKSTEHPFGALYSGGYLFGTGDFPSNTFQNLALSQGLYGKHVSLLVADYISYTPQTPEVGLSGIPGTGDVSIAPVSVTGQDGLGLLTTYSTRVTNTVSGTLTTYFTPKTNVSFTGADVIQRYTGANSGGIGNDQYSANGTLTHEYNSRTSLGGGYTFYASRFNYGGSNGVYGYDTHSWMANYQRQVTRRLNLQLSAGPQLLTSNGGSLLTHSSVSAAVNGSLVYTGRVYTDSLTFNRSTSNGNGVVIGSEQNALLLLASRQLGRLWSVSGSVGYNHSSSLPDSTLPAYTSDAVVFGGQGNVRLSRSLSAFASYTLQRQDFSGFAASGIAFNGLLQNVAFGLTYAPKPVITAR